MKKLRWFAITLFLLSVAVYALDQNQIRRKTDQTIPKISMDQDEIQVSVKDPEKVWKKGITAYDEKDGDITDSLVIESVSTFLEKGRRLVSYAAFDRDGHVAKASRQLIYTDYHSPKISCAKPFSFPVGTQDILDSVYATDCIDGDISNKVEITGDSVFFLNIAGEYEIWLQVTNSCGDMVTVPVTLEMVDYRQQTERTKRAEAEKQMEMAGEYPDIIIGCFGGGSNFGGICFPFMRHTILEGKQTRYVAAEPASCPKLTRGKFEYDFGDEAGYTPLLPMFTLGHNFTPANIHAGGLRYHGAGVIVSQLLKDHLMEAVDIQQLETFEAGCLFARAEGIIPAPESCHAIAAAIQEANKCKETGEEKVILFNLSGHGLIDMSAYDQYLSGNLTNYTLTDKDIEKSLGEVETMQP